MVFAGSPLALNTKMPAFYLGGLEGGGSSLSLKWTQFPRPGLCKRPAPQSKLLVFPEGSQARPRGSACTGHTGLGLQTLGRRPALEGTWGLLSSWAPTVNPSQASPVQPPGSSAIPAGEAPFSEGRPRPELQGHCRGVSTSSLPGPEQERGAGGERSPSGPLPGCSLPLPGRVRTQGESRGRHPTTGDRVGAALLEAGVAATHQRKLEFPVRVCPTAEWDIAVEPGRAQSSHRTPAGPRRSGSSGIWAPPPRRPRAHRVGLLGARSRRFPDSLPPTCLACGDRPTLRSHVAFRRHHPEGFGDPTARPTQRTDVQEPQEKEWDAQAFPQLRPFQSRPFIYIKKC
ncbi:uncharacterized protein WM277_017598 [Molossus nigricans]